MLHIDFTFMSKLLAVFFQTQMLSAHSKAYPCIGGLGLQLSMCKYENMVTHLQAECLCNIILQPERHDYPVLLSSGCEAARFC